MLLTNKDLVFTHQIKILTLVVYGFRPAELPDHRDEYWNFHHKGEGLISKNAELMYFAITCGQAG
ncbi:MAG: hypothetical protein DI535_21365 [Citrobacter freundii]|nr:MAG: hypothetical protein DI535_21365 [Citrobacter freundii]